MPTNPTPAARLQRALDEYWPDHSIHFSVRKNHRAFLPYGNTNGIVIDSTISSHNVATIAAVAAAWFRKIARQKQSEWDSVVRLEVKEEPFGPVWARTLGIVRKAKEAADTFDEIYEAATEVA